MNIFDISSIIGLVLITAGLFLIKRKQRKEQYYLFFLGGLLLEVYSIYINNIIFIILQALFTISALYELIKLSHIK